MLLVSCGSSNSNSNSSGSTPTPIVSIMAGSTTRGNPVDGTGSSAVFWGGGCVAVDGQGNVFVSDRGYLRKITSAGVVTTLALTDSTTVCHHFSQYRIHNLGHCRQYLCCCRISNRKNYFCGFGEPIGWVSNARFRRRCRLRRLIWVDSGYCSG